MMNTRLCLTTVVLRACMLAGAWCVPSFAGAGTAGSPAFAVEVVRTVPWSPGDAERSGACEFEIFMKVAQLQQSGLGVGLVGVGNHNGRLPHEAERALAHVTLRGVPVVRIAQNGGVMPAGDDALFLPVEGLSETEARGLLMTCLERYGAPPSAQDPANPTLAERAAIRRHLERYKEVFLEKSAPALALAR